MRKIVIPAVVVIVLVAAVIYAWPHMINLMLPADSRPVRIAFVLQRASREAFEKTAGEVVARYPGASRHVEIFRKARLLGYEGPKTCLTCHKVMTVTDPVSGQEKKVELIKNLTTSVHYRFFTVKHSNVWGFNGAQAANFPMGKFDRPCPKPGSFAMTAWAEIVRTRDGRVYSEGCGQCHVGGQVQAPLGDIMPFYTPLPRETGAVDCLICHSEGYDMNLKQVVEDRDGRRRWGQDRTLKAALTVTKPTAQACLRCHQHNFGGDIYVDEAGPSFMQSIRNPGRERPRVMHPGSKRGTPFSPTWDVHAAAGLSCLECHASEGHLIAKGTHTTTMMADDLPDVEVACEKCHTASPHGDARLNLHTTRLACQTCHIPSLQADNATMRDFSRTVFEPGAGLYVYTDELKETGPGKGIVYAWWNGDATFLGNPIGDNPNNKNLYRFYRPDNIWPEFTGYDYAAWYERVMRPIAKRKPSKLYAMKRYNGKQHIDLKNIGPFGGMFVPYNLPVYLSTGDPGGAAKAEVRKSMIEMMYGWMFKFYLMDRFMAFMSIESWDTSAYQGLRGLKNAEPRWLPNDASMEISHAIRKKGALSCRSCHSPRGVLDWAALGYAPAEITRLSAETEGTR